MNNLTEKITEEMEETIENTYELSVRYYQMKILEILGECKKLENDGKLSKKDKLIAQEKIEKYLQLLESWDEKYKNDVLEFSNYKIPLNKLKKFRMHELSYCLSSEKGKWKKKTKMALSTEKAYCRKMANNAGAYCLKIKDGMFNGKIPHPLSADEFAEFESKYLTTKKEKKEWKEFEKQQKMERKEKDEKTGIVVLVVIIVGAIMFAIDWAMFGVIYIFLGGFMGVGAITYKILETE